MAIGSFFPEISGGATHIATIIDNLKGKDEFYVFCGCSDHSLAGRSVYKGVKVYRIADDLSNLAQRFISAFKTIKGYIIFGLNCDILHAHGFTQMNMVLIFIAKIFRKKVIFSIHTAGHDDPVSVANSRLGKIKAMFFKLPDRIIAVSPGLFELSKNYGLDCKRLIFIPNGIDTQRFKPFNQVEKSIRRKELNLPGLKDRLILFVGYMTREKGLHLLLKAWSKLGNRQNLKIIAICQQKINTFNRSYASKVKKYVAENRFSNDIIFIEKTFEMEKYLSAADLFILPSYREGLPNTLLEAMSTGLACICAKLDGSTDLLIQDKINGYLFKKGNSRDLTKKLAVFLDNDPFLEKIGRSARETILANYNIADSIVRYREIYDK